MSNIPESDKELLELAAKAAGYRICHFESDTRAYVADDATWTHFYWAPRDDDGDALRLAVKLGLAIRPLEKCVFVESNPETLLGFSSVSELEMYGNSAPYAATRRAIVRAAAEIGRSKE